MWQTLHTSLRDLHNDFSRYEEELSYLSNYTLNNAIVISKIAQARVDDGGSILALINSSTWLGQQVYILKAAVMQVSVYIVCMGDVSKSVFIQHRTSQGVACNRCFWNDISCFEIYSKNRQIFKKFADKQIKLTILDLGQDVNTSSDTLT